MTKKDTNLRDVRMRGFVDRATVDAAWNWIDAHADPLESEVVPFEDAHGRVLASDVASAMDVPAFDRAAMDGYALRGAETDGASEYNPLMFSVVGESMPGSPYAGELPPGTAIRIMTGSPLPTDANAVVPAEYADESEGDVRLTTAVSPGKHVGRRGEDVAAGNRLLAAGRRLRPQDVGLLASVGVTEVNVVRRPRVRLVVTGNELVPPGEARGEYQIFESNSSMLRGLILRDGGELESNRHVQDVHDAVREALLAGGADVLLVSGGSSVGREDLAPLILREEGNLAIHGIAMRPSSPTGIGRIGSAVAFLLPGNPVSCLCAYDFFAARSIRLLGGRTADWPYHTVPATVGPKKIVSAVGRVDYCRVRLDGDLVEPIALSGASILSSTTRADGFVIVPAQREGYAPGANVDVFLYDLLN
jgi:molybdopterin molybdotransferase